MKNRFLFLIWLLSAAISSIAQDISSEQADSMRKTLNKTTTTIDRINLLLTLAQYQVFKPGELKTDLDSAEAYIDEAAALAKSIKSPTIDGYLILTRSYLTYERGNKEDAKKLAEQAVAILESGNNKSNLGKAYYQLSSFYDYRDSLQMEIKISLVRKAIDAFQQAGNLERKAFSLTMLADLYSIKVDYQNALEALQSSLATYESIGYKRLQGVYVLLGRIYRRQDDYRHALQYELKALKTAESVGDTSMQICQINTLLGHIYDEMDQYELGIKYYRDALHTAEKYDDRYSVSLILYLISSAYTDANRWHEAILFLASVPKKYQEPKDDFSKYYFALAYAEPYISGKQLNKAQPYCSILLKLSESNSLSNSYKNTINRTLADYFLARGQYPSARINMTRVKDVSNQLEIAEDCTRWYKLDSAQGNYKSAFNNLRLNKNINDSVFNATKTRQLQQLEIEYETAKKEDSIRLKDQDIKLLTQKNSLQQASLDQVRIIRNGTMVGIILTLAIIGLLYRQYQLKQKSNITISDKNEQLQHLVSEKDWLVKEIHHRVKNNFQTVMGLLGTQCVYLNSEEAKTAIRDSQQRIQTMSLIHQRLYQTENLSGILMPDYVHELLDYLRESYTIGNRIRFKLEIEPIEMDLAHSIPLGLILNEAISNSFKYAFPDNQQGMICISLHFISGNNILLTIADNGIGLPPAFNVSRSNSMGMNLMRGLCAEMDAQFHLSGKEGTRIDISFTYTPVQSGPFNTLLADAQLDQTLIR